MSTGQLLRHGTSLRTTLAVMLILAFGPVLHAQRAELEKRVRRETLPNGLEVIVVENDSRDDTVARARAAGATVLQHPFRTIGAQRNIFLVSVLSRSQVCSMTRQRASGSPSLTFSSKLCSSLVWLMRLPFSATAGVR